MPEYTAFVGCYTKPQSFCQTGCGEGVYVIKVNTDTGSIERVHPKGFDAGVNPSFMDLVRPSPKGPTWIYAVNDDEEELDHSVTGLEIQDDFSLRKLGVWKFDKFLVTPHISTAFGGKKLLIASYGGGNIRVLGIDPKTGNLDLEYFEEIEGASGVNPSRQEKSHAHFITEDQATGLVFVADLGTDKVSLYKFNEDGTFEPYPVKDANTVCCPPGAGPRHIAFNPVQPFIYVSGELDNSVITFEILNNPNPKTATEVLKFVQTIPTIPSPPCENAVSDIHCSKNGKYVYVANRGHETITHFKVVGSKGLELVNRYETLGKWIRNFAITPDGKMLLAEHQVTDTIVGFWISEETGALIPTGSILECGTPVCIKFF